jgi:hypothetical protein
MVDHLADRVRAGHVVAEACGAAGRYEAALTAPLAQLAPEWTLQQALPDASDADRHEWGRPVTGWLEELV